MEVNSLLSPGRELTREEEKLLWKKPAYHVESETEKRIKEEVRRSWYRGSMKITTLLLEGDAGSGKTQLAKALSASFGLPYTKVTCFADMDKSDVLGSILPVLEKGEGESKTEAGAKFVTGQSASDVKYQFYPSEIVKAYENGWLLEIQEPTVIRDSAVLMALNSALEPDGSINLPTRVVRRHPDFIAVITTNRGYNGCRPLNEALRDRVQHAERMDLPPKSVMMERGASQTGCADVVLLNLLAEAIIILDETAKAHSIKGVAGMRSYLFWVDAVSCGQPVLGAMYQKVIYKITTDEEEICVLESALQEKEIFEQLEQLETQRYKNPDADVMEMKLDDDREYSGEVSGEGEPPAVMLRKSADSEGRSGYGADSVREAESEENGENGAAIYHELVSKEISLQEKKAFRKQLNQKAKASVKGTIHQQVGLIVHRPEATDAEIEAYKQKAAELASVIRELVWKVRPFLEYESSAEFSASRFYGSKFCADKVAFQDFRHFTRKYPPCEKPSLAVALRIDESASMTAFGRLEAARDAAVAIYEFCRGCGIPILIYGDTADRSPREQMSVYSYVDFDSGDPDDKYSLMGIQGRSNNRDGMALRIVCERLLRAAEKTRLCISVSDGQPKAMPDYTGELAVQDMKNTLRDYRLKGITFLAAAIGQDKEIISEIYGNDSTVDISDLKQLPARLIQIVARYL